MGPRWEPDRDGKRLGVLAVLVLTFVLALPSPAARRSAAAELDAKEQQAFQAAVERVGPSVVRIETVGGRRRIGRYLVGTGATSGLIVDSQGFVISSSFSFLHDPATVLVHLADGTRKPARIVATDHTRKLTLLKIEPEAPLPVPPFAAAGEVRVGQWAIAVGRAFEVDRPNSAVGIISAVDRIWGKAIQTDAAVSPNNYGGPLVDVRGRVVGLLVPMSPQSDDELAGVEWYDSGIGFAVPSDDLLGIVARLKQGKDLRPGLLGITFSPGSVLLLPARIRSVRPNSPAYQAKLQAGDVVVEMAGHPTARAADLKLRIARHYAGDTVRLAWMRERKRLEGEVTLAAEIAPYGHPFLGILPRRPLVGEAAHGPAGVDDKLGAGLPTPPRETAPGPTGVGVRYVFADSPAATAGVRQGDRLVKLDGQPVVDVKRALAVLGEHQPGDAVKIAVARGDKTVELTATLAAQPEAVPPDALPAAHDAPAGEPAPAPRPGVRRLEIPDRANEIWVDVPKTYDRRIPHGLVVWLPPPGEFDHQGFFDDFRAAGEGSELLLAVVRSSRPSKWLVGEASLVQQVLDQLRQSYAIDPARVVVGGQQGGGTLAYRVAFAGREVVRAVAAVEAPALARPPENEPPYRLAFFVGKSDGSDVADRIDANVSLFRRMKYPVTICPLGKTFRPLDRGELLLLARWIDTLDRI